MNRHEPITQGYSLGGLAMRDRKGLEGTVQALCRHIRMCVRKQKRERDTKKEKAQPLRLGIGSTY